MTRLWIAAVILCCTVTAKAVETVKWDRSVIPVDLIVGVEQMVQFPGSASVGLPVSLADTDVFRHLFAGDTAYWKAMQPFDTHRVKVRLEETGEFVLFDLRARSLRQPPESVEPLKIVIDVDSENTGPGDVAEDAPVTMFELLRYAAQADYAPPRLVRALGGVRPIENTVTSELSALYQHPDRAAVDMFVHRMYVADGWFVTSIRVKNRTANEVTIDPSRMQHTAHNVVNGVNAHFVASAMVYRTLRPRGDALDETMLYVITDRPFAAVIDL